DSPDPRGARKGAARRRRHRSPGPPGHRLAGDLAGAAAALGSGSGAAEGGAGMNRLRFLTAGESHGPALVGILDGLPAGLILLAEHIERDLQRRKLGYGRGGRMAIEPEKPRILAGVRHGRTLGSPLALLIENADHPKAWSDRMAVEPVADPGKLVSLPRPGHADLTGSLKFGHRDLRNSLERASARETAMRVGLAAVARRLLDDLDVRV